MDNLELAQRIADAVDEELHYRLVNFQAADRAMIFDTLFPVPRWLRGAGRLRVLLNRVLRRLLSGRC